MIVYREYYINSARFLPNLPKDHICSNLHGHTYYIKVSVKGPINHKTGFVIDFGHIEAGIKPIYNQIDHNYLNDIEGLENPTSENMCKYIWEKIKPEISGLVEIEIKETHSTGCIYKGD